MMIGTITGWEGDYGFRISDYVQPPKLRERIKKFVLPA